MMRSYVDAGASTDAPPAGDRLHLSEVGRKFELSIRSDTSKKVPSKLEGYEADANIESRKTVSFPKKKET